MEKSMLNVAYDYVVAHKGEVSFKDIWAYVCKTLGFTKEEADNKVARFYANLMLDGRFVTLGENKWTLRIREKFEKVHIDMNDVYSDVESDSDTSDADDSAAEDARAEQSALGEPVTDDDNLGAEEDSNAEEGENKESSEF